MASSGAQAASETRLQGRPVSIGNLKMVYATSKGGELSAKTLIAKGVIVSALLLAACNPIPATSVPTPAPTPTDRNPMQMDVYDFARWLARTDIHGDESIGPDRYVDALLALSTCLGEDQSEAMEQQDLTPGEAAASQWWTISIWMHSFITGLMEEPMEGVEPTYISALETMSSACLEEK